MTARELEATLLAAGYTESAVRDGLEAYNQGSYPLFYVRQWEVMGYDRFFVELKFETNGMDIQFADGHAGLVRVPLEHKVIGSVDTGELEKRIEPVTWSYDYPFLMGELPEDKQIAELAQVTVPGIFNDLAILYSNSAAGKELAEQLLVRHIAWHYSSDRNDPLHALIGQKYYATVELDRIVVPASCYRDLEQRPIPNIDMTKPVANFIQRHLSYYSPISKIPIIMNLNNLENLKEEVKELRFNDKLLPQMEQNMQKSLPEFQLHDSKQGNKGQVDFTLHFKKSGQSDFYYLNKYDVYLNKTTPLEDGQKYMVLSKGDDNKPVFKSFINPHEAIDYFKGQKGDSELAIGKDPGNKSTLATMEKEKVNYVAKDFQKTYYSPAITHTMYVEQGKGFTAEQAANLIEGRSVYRDDLLNLGGQPYKAWVVFDMDKGKDRNNNFQTRQFHDPSYGFNLKEALAEYNIKELTDPAKAEKLEETLKNGNRPLITTVQDGKEAKLHIEAVPRYGKINFFQENGKPEKREQFEVAKVVSLPEKEKAQGKELGESRGVRM